MRLSSNGRVLVGAGLALGVVLGILFWRALFQDRVLAPTDLIFTSDFFAGVKPKGFSRPSNPLLYDQVYQFVPWRRFARESLLAGHLPLWNPHSLAGTPFVATQQTAVFYPINLLLLAVPFERTFVWSAFLRLWIAGMLTFLLARRVGLPPLPSLIAGFAYMLSGYLVVGVGHPHIGVAIWLPGIALGAELALAARGRSQTLRTVALLALLVGVQFTAGHIETSVDILLGTTLYLLIRWRQLGWSRETAIGGRLRPLLVFGAGWVLGAGLGAVQLVPFFEWLPLSEEAGTRAAITSFALFDAGTLKNLLLLPLFVFPNLYNNPTWDPPYFDFLPWGRNYHGDILYVGVLSFLLALVALARCWRSEPVVRAWAIVGFFALGRALYLPVFDWLNHLPVLELGKPHLFRLVASFSVCMLGGFGARALFADRRGGEARTANLWRAFCAGVVGAGVALMLVGKFVLPAARDRLADIDRQRAELFYQSIGGETTAKELEQEGRRMARNTIRAFRPTNVAMYLPAAVAAAGLLVGWMARRRGWSLGLRGTLLVLATGELVGFGWNYNPTVRRKDFYPAPPILASLTRDPTLFRFSATRRDLVADAHMMFGLSDIRGLDFPTRWYATYAKLAPEHVAWRKITFDGFDSPLLRVLNLKYVFASSARVPLSPERVERMIPAGRGRLWQLRTPQPRSFMVYRARAVGTDEEAAGLLRREPEAVFSRVLLSVESEEVPPTTADSADGQGMAEVKVIEYGPRRSVWRVTTDRAGYLVTSDAYYPGWKAELDGRPARLYRANLAFRAVRVPAGDHVIVHRFAPASVQAGLAITGASLVLAGALLIAAARLARAGTAAPERSQ